MNLSTSIPLEVSFSLRAFRLPSLGRFVSSISHRLSDQYAFMSLAFLGMKEDLLSGHLKPTVKDISDLTRIEKLLSLVVSSIRSNDSLSLNKIKVSAGTSIETIREIKNIIEDFERERVFKKDFAAASLKSMEAFLNKQA